MLTTILLVGVVQLSWIGGVRSNQFERTYDFESQNPFRYWTSNGAYKINELRIVASDDLSHGLVGKIDVELIDASYVYFSIDTNLPLDGSFRLSGDIRIEKAVNASATLGANIAITPIRRSGVYTLQPIKCPSGWVNQSANIGLVSREKAAKIVDRSFYGVSVDDVGVWLDRIGLFVRGKPGGRIVIDLDNIRLKGDLPDPTAFVAKTEAAWSASNLRIQNHLNNLAGPILKMRPLADRNALPLHEELQKATNRLFEHFSKNGFISSEDYATLCLYAETARHMDQKMPESLAIYPWEPTSSILILPNTFPVPAALGNTLSIQACRGEYEPASFILRSVKKLPYLTIKASDLFTQTGQMMPAEAIDIRLVKCWFQAGSGDLHQKHTKILVPELLLKDNGLVRVDLDKQTNALRGFQNGKLQYFDITRPESKIPPEAVINDATQLEPFDLAPDFNQQIWLTIKIPEAAESGRYHGLVSIQSMGKTLADLDLDVTVLPFELPPPALEYAIYYRGKLVPCDKAAIGSEFKSETQYRLEMADLKAHGIDSPTLYQPFDNQLDRALDIRQQAGLSLGNLFLLSLKTNPPFDPVGLTQLETMVRKWKVIADQKGYTKLYVYGIDEAKDDLIAEQLPAWQIVKTNSGNVFVACPHHADVLAGKNMELGILNGPLDHSTAKRWSESGLKVYSYGNPQIGVENPGVYRSNYGFKLWSAGYNGAMNYAYQHAFGDIWNDFDHPKYRDHVFAFPVSNGLISTVQWEGFREAVDDARYLALLVTRSDSGKYSDEPLPISIDTDPSLSPSYIRNSIINELLN